MNDSTAPQPGLTMETIGLDQVRGRTTAYRMNPVANVPALTATVSGFSRTR
jgi:hypothetical protein